MCLEICFSCFVRIGRSESFLFSVNRDVFYRLYFHFVWSTAGRSPILDGRIDSVILCVTEAAQRFGGHVLACNDMPDHVHLLVSLPPIDLAHFIGKVKGGSSFALNQYSLTEEKLSWQDGYGIVSLRASDTESVIRYINEQEQIATHDKSQHMTNRNT
jgi:REP element-mobilizing transposase RayT